MTNDPGFTLAKSFRINIVMPTLKRIGLYSFAAEQMLMGTAAIESRFFLRRQYGNGPALGLFQMEPKTFLDLMGVLSRKEHSHLKEVVCSLAGTTRISANLLFKDDPFAAAMARVRYEVVPEPLPLSVDGQAHYWKKYYNGNSKHGLSVQDYIGRWNELCAPIYNRKI